MAAADSPAGLDTAAVSAWIDALGLGAQPPLRFERIGNGFSNLTFLVSDASGGRWVLRRPPHGELLASAHDVEREHRILRALGATPVPAPRVFGLCADPAVSPVPLLLMEHLDGLVIDSFAAAERLTPGLRSGVGTALPRALAKVHAVDLEATGLAALSASRTPYAARQIKRWRGQWEQSRTRELPAVDRLAERLWAAMPEQRETVLVHGDFHLLNAIVSPEDGEVRAILDWELCTLGDPLADLGGLLAYWPGPDDPPGPLIHFGLLPGFPPREQIAATYAEAAGRPLDALGFWEALGIWKVAIIAEGVLRRSREDPRNAGAAGAPSPAEIAELVDRALAVAERAGI